MIPGRYILQPEVMRILDRKEKGAGGEIQLTDALLTQAQSGAPGGGVVGVVFRGNRYDTGDRLDYLKAVVRLAVRHRDIGAEFRTWLAEWVDTDEGAGRLEDRQLRH